MEIDNAMKIDSDTETIHLCESKREKWPVSNDEEDETVAERLWALTEIFPESIRMHTNNLIRITKKAVVESYSFARNYLWYISTAGTMLFVPIYYENLRYQRKEELVRHSRKLLLGFDNGTGSLDNDTTLLPY